MSDLRIDCFLHVKLCRKIDRTGEQHSPVFCHILEIIIYPPPELAGFANAQPATTAKPVVSWGWDWHPRLIPSGIWDETFLEVRPGSHLSDIWIDYTLDSGLTAADIRIHVEGSEALPIPLRHGLCHYGHRAV